jgi:hypothetical protein
MSAKTKRKNKKQEAEGKMRAGEERQGVRRKT